MNITKYFNYHLWSYPNSRNEASISINYQHAVETYSTHLYSCFHKSISGLIHIKKYSLLMILLVSTLTSNATTSEYRDQMKSAIDRLEVSESLSSYTALANDFEVIANAYSKEWLPKYYMAACYVFITLNENIKLNEDEIETYQKMADDILDELKENHPNESEIHTLIALYYVSKVTHGPLYKMLFSYWKFQSAIDKSLELNPDNPRALYQQLASEMGKAEEFGNDLSQYCDRAHQLHDKWDSFTPASELHPTWGKKDLAKLLDKCSKS